MSLLDPSHQALGHFAPSVNHIAYAGRDPMIIISQFLEITHSICIALDRN